VGFLPSCMLGRPLMDGRPSGDTFAPAVATPKGVMVMAHVRRVGLGIAALVVTATLVAAYVAEGLGLALIAAIGFFVIAAMLIPIIAVFEEERDLPFAQAARRRAAKR
jgi:hypothetical protein